MLNKVQLKSNIKKDIKNVEKKLYDSLNNKNNGIYSILKKIDDTMKAQGAPSKEFDEAKFKDKMWTIISEEWSKALSKQIIDTISEEFSAIISDRMTDYIKSATITIPPGQTTSTVFTSGLLPGATTNISPNANIS